MFAKNYADLRSGDYEELQGNPNNKISSQSCRILLAEDDDANAMVATALLEMLGYTFDVVGSGLHAIEKIKTGVYGIAVMDVKLHDLGGLEATRLIRAFERETGCRPLPIFAVTAHAFTGERERCLAAGMNDYLAKPFDFEEFGQKLALLRQNDMWGQL